ncbi:MAG: hypothetical protein HRT83_05280 [Hyphomicrobiaceae bacterium]|nr:hypothetical protein [Hyphomicrobiaceae bacterium]
MVSRFVIAVKIDYPFWYLIEILSRFGMSSGCKLTAPSDSANTMKFHIEVLQTLVGNLLPHKP